MPMNFSRKKALAAAAFALLFAGGQARLANPRDLQGCIICTQGIPECREGCKECVITPQTCEACAFATCLDDCVICTQEVPECEEGCVECEITPQTCEKCAFATCLDP